MKRSLILIIAILILTAINTYANVGLLNRTKPKLGNEYIVILNNGDIISGELSEFINSKEDGEGIKLITDYGKITIYETQINDIYSESSYYRHSNRMLLMPTAYPIKNNHYASDMELLFPNIGFGISDYVSVIGGISLIPVDKLARQISLINLKFTVLNMDFEEDDDISNFALALGANGVWLNSDNSISHLFAISSIKFNSTVISGGLFYKLGNKEFYSFRLDNNIYNFSYMDGSFGVALGLDKEINSKGTHLFIEIWNGDITRSFKSAIASGIRFTNKSFAADFGLMYAASFPIPVMNFTWTPF